MNRPAHVKDCGVGPFVNLAPKGGAQLTSRAADDSARFQNAVFLVHDHVCFRLDSIYGKCEFNTPLIPKLPAVRFNCAW